MNEKLISDAQMEQNRFELLMEEKKEMETTFEEKLRKLREFHENELTELETQYQQKVMTEVGKYHELSKEKNKDNKD